MVHHGPARIRERSSTLMPSSAAAIEFCPHLPSGVSKPVSSPVTSPVSNSRHRPARQKSIRPPFQMGYIGAMRSDRRTRGSSTMSTAAQTSAESESESKRQQGPAKLSNEFDW